VTGDRAFHNLLQRPRDNPWRTAIGAALFSWVTLVFLFGAADRAYVLFGMSYVTQLWVYRVLVWVLPLAVLLVTKRVCDELRAGERVKGGPVGAVE
jgi:ubiquinol-cytochrome c reductase cytochrome b subunit